MSKTEYNFHGIRILLDKNYITFMEGFSPAKDYPPSYAEFNGGFDISSWCIWPEYLKEICNNEQTMGDVDNHTWFYRKSKGKITIGCYHGQATLTNTEWNTIAKAVNIVIDLEEIPIGTQLELFNE